MKVISRDKVKSIKNVCGTIKELYSSRDLSLSIATITGKSTPHMHKRMEEIYFVIKGSGRIFIGDESKIIKEGDLIVIPKNKFHYVQTEDNETIEVIVATHPGFDKNDVIEKMSRLRLRFALTALHFRFTAFRSGRLTQYMRFARCTSLSHILLYFLNTLYYNNFI